MTVQTKSLHEITHDAVAVLFREIGIANTVRFINQFTLGRGDYTEERRELFAGMSLDDIVNEIRSHRVR